MALEDASKKTLPFPNEPAFLVAVEIRDVPEHGIGHKGVFSSQHISKGTKVWEWTDRVEKIHHEQLNEYIDEKFGKENVDAVSKFLRQGFVLPKQGDDGKEDDFFYSNPTDAGRFTNHSNNPNCGMDGALRDIENGEELTMDYSFHGNPPWYQELCKTYHTLTETEVVKLTKVLASQDIAKGAKFWEWIDRVENMHYELLNEYIDEKFGKENANAVSKFLRQGFVLP